MAPATNKSKRSAILAFIDEVKKRRVLWDPTDEDYMDREATANAWTEIADNLSSSGLNVQGDIKLKWKCLRDTYRRIERTMQGKDNKRPRWPYFKRLTFLQPAQKKRRAKSSDDGAVYLDLNEDKSQQPYEYIKCEGGSENEDDMRVIETELDTLNRDDDYEVMFLKSLAPYMRALEPMRQLIVRNKIQDILLNEMAAQQTQQNTKEF